MCGLASREAASKLKNLKPRDLSTFSLVTQLGFTVVTALVLSLLLGLWLDSRLGTSPLMTLVFSMFGVLVGTIGVYRLVTKAIAEAAANMPRPKARDRADEVDDEWEDADRVEDDPWSDEDDEKDEWDRDPWHDEDEDSTENRRAGRDEVERQLGLRPPKVKPGNSEDEQR